MAPFVYFLGKKGTEGRRARGEGGGGALKGGHTSSFDLQYARPVRIASNVLLGCCKRCGELSSCGLAFLFFIFYLEIRTCSGRCTVLSAQIFRIFLAAIVIDVRSILRCRVGRVD